MSIHSSNLAWKFSWTEEVGGLRSVGLQSGRFLFAPLPSVPFLSLEPTPLQACTSPDPHPMTRPTQTPPQGSPPCLSPAHDPPNLSPQGNKGGVSVRLAAFGHMLCFLNCHLPAHMDKAEQRKDNFQTILSLQQFQGPGAQGILDHEYGPLGAWVGLVEEAGEGSGNPLQYSCLENPVDRGA